MAALDVLSLLAEYGEDFPRAELLREESLALARELGDKASAARALVGLGNLKRVNPEGLSGGHSMIEEGLALYREIGHKAGIASSLRMLGFVIAQEGESSQAAVLLEKSVALSRELGDKGGVAFSTFGLALLALYREDLTAARACAQESHDLYHEVGNKWGMAGSLGFLGYLAARDGDYERASVLAIQSLTCYRELRDPIGAHYSALVLVLVAVARGRPERAVRLMAAAESLRLNHLSPLWSVPLFVFDWEQQGSALRARIGDQAFEAIQAKGRAMSLAETIAFALEDPPVSRHEEAGLGG